MRARLQQWAAALLSGTGGPVTTETTVGGLPVTVVNTRPEIATSDVLSRLDSALALIERVQPAHFRRLRRDFREILVKRFPCRGAYLPETRTCLVELTFTVNPEFTPSQIAATILHEAMHARLDRAGVRLSRVTAARHERFCRRAELEFGQLVPDGQPVVERALESLALADDEVAPVIDWALASRRVASADLRAMPGPEWLKRIAARRLRLDDASLLRPPDP